MPLYVTADVYFLGDSSRKAGLSVVFLGCRRWWDALKSIFIKCVCSVCKLHTVVSFVSFFSLSCF